MDRPSSTSSSEPGVLRRLPWAALVAVLLLAALEIAARRRFDPRFVGEETYAKYYPAYDYGFEGAPVCWRMGPDRVCQPTPYLDVVRQTFPAQKPKKTRWIFTIGSSVSRGDGVRAYSNALENDLRRERLREHVQVINLSASSTGSRRQLLRVEEVLRYTPDLLLIQLHGRNESKDERDLAYSAELHQGLGGLALRSHAVVALKKYYAEKTETEIPAYGARDATSERDLSPEAWERSEVTLQQNLDRMLTLAERAKVRVILVGSAQNTHGYAGEIEARVNEILARHAGPNVTFFDTPAVLAAAEDGTDKKLFKDRVHYTPVGHKAIADALVPMVRHALAL